MRWGSVGSRCRFRFVASEFYSAARAAIFPIQFCRDKFGSTAGTHRIRSTHGTDRIRSTDRMDGIRRRPASNRDSRRRRPLRCHKPAPPKPSGFQQSQDISRRWLRGLLYALFSPYELMQHEQRNPFAAIGEQLHRWIDFGRIPLLCMQSLYTAVRDSRLAISSLVAPIKPSLCKIAHFD